MKKNLIFRKRHLYIIAGCLYVSLNLTGCSSVELLQESVTVEAGDSVSEDPSDYAEFSNDSLKEAAYVDLENVKTDTVGTYQAAVVSENKEYPFTVNIVDTTAPVVELMETQILTNNSTIKADDFIDSIEDVSEYYIGLRNPVMELTDAEVREDFLSSQAALEGLEGEELEDAEAKLDEEVEALESWTELVANPEELTETLELDADGQYLVELVVADASGNATVSEVVVFLDATPPTVEGTDSVTLSFKSMLSGNTTDAMIIQNVKVDDNMFGDLTPYIVFEKMTDDGENNMVVEYSVMDYAGNQSNFSIDVTVEGVPSMESLMLAMAGGSDGSGSGTSTEGATEVQADGFDRARAEEAFALVNEQRTANGLAALAWDESLYELACVRAQEIVGKFSHERPDGTWVTDSLYAAGCSNGNGENISRYGKTASETVDGWMSSPSHKANICESRFNYGVMACYQNNGNYYWVNLFKA